jgi:hypothetical protein
MTWLVTWSATVQLFAGRERFRLLAMKSLQATETYLPNDLRDSAKEGLPL